MNIEEAVKICKEYFPIMDTSFSPQVLFFKNEDSNYLSASITFDNSYIMVSRVSENENNNVEMVMYDLNTMDKNKLEELLRKSEQS